MVRTGRLGSLHEKEAFKDREQFSIILQGPIMYYAERSKKHQQDSEADEKDRTMAVSGSTKNERS